MAVQRCPYLGLEDLHALVVPPPSPQHRCLVQAPPERVEVSYQTEVCLTPEFRWCKRLAAVRAHTLQQVQREPRTEPEASAEVKPEAREAAAVDTQTSRRSITALEILVLGLGISIVFASLFIAYAIVHRLRVGPGMGAAGVVADNAARMTAEALPTLVPTFTPTPLPTEAPSAQVSAIAPGPTPVPEPVVPVPTPIVRVPASSPPTRLVIPAIAVDIPILTVGTKSVREGGKLKVVWDDLPNGGGFHQTSAYPGNPGNTVINGHRDILGAVFRNLDKVQPGDEIMLYVGDEKYPYVAVETVVVPELFASAEQRARNLQYIGYMPEERLTLVTCTPVGLGTHRLLVIAKPPDQGMPEMPAAGSDAGQ